MPYLLARSATRHTASECDLHPSVREKIRESYFRPEGYAVAVVSGLYITKWCQKGADIHASGRLGNKPPLSNVTCTGIVLKSTGTGLLDKISKADSNDFVSTMILPIEVGKPNYRESELP